MKTWIIADWHLGETRMALMQRPFKNPEEMLEHLVQKHNELVVDDDLVYVVGDVCNQNTPDELPEVGRFNGHKVLIRGNHDRVISDDDFSKWFDNIIPEGDGIELDVAGIPCYITHYPSQSVSHRFNLVGHIHGAWKYQLNMLNVGVDANHFVPHNLDEAVPFFLKAITEFYDDDVWAAYAAQNHMYIGKRGKKSVYFSKTPK